LSGLPQYVQAALQTWRAPGLAVAVVQGGRVVLAQGFGVRAQGGKAPIDAHTRFATASLTKMFTAAAAGQEVAAGRLAWDEPIAPAARLRIARPQGDGRALAARRAVAPQRPG
jgi:CubicO group peptidase (beta-lactamase class C family)